MVATRRSRSNLSGDDESVTSSNMNIEQQEREPLLASISEQRIRRPPPPPPPPPMPTAVTGNSPGTATTPRPASSQPAGMMNTNNNSRINQNEDVNIEEREKPIVQYLQVRVIPAYGLTKVYRSHQKSQPSHLDSRQLHRRKHQSTVFNAQSSRGDIVRVLIPSEGFSSERQLSECLIQACNADDGTNNLSIQNDADDGSWDTEEYFEDRKLNVAGMFRENDGVFVPLSIIYSQPRAFANDVLSMNRPARLKDTPPVSRGSGKNSIFVAFLEIVGVLAVTYASWLTYSATQRVDWALAVDKVEFLFLATVNVPFYIFDVLIEFPLRELYRHGPSMVGWEGESLERICSRITHYGDEAFWSRNMEECAEIYASKEAAAMQIHKPILIGFIILMLFYMVKSIMEAHAMRRQQLDPNMVETYRAITMLARQLKRAVNANR
ncbi:hypothetical protein ACHAWO_008255 [Cyclotella atomus]|uniref:Uncharacterized protein n=1 Tax=Cyclotella atomus TaxID=382360 RepID=A0ABD3MX91_9STRA